MGCMTPLETRVFELEGYVSKLHTEMEELHKQIAELRDRKITVTTSSAFDPAAAAARTIEETVKTKAPSAPRPPVPHASGSTTSTTKTVTINFNGPPVAEDIHKLLQDVCKGMGL